MISAQPMIVPAVSAFVRIGATTSATPYRRHALVTSVASDTTTSSTIAAKPLAPRAERVRQRASRAEERRERTRCTNRLS
jgi:hypothetical protein